MHVTRVELENIKAYEKASFDFARGTTAIVGKNGAGKTTILEAIAWALFDSLEYSKNDFVRRGAKKGVVRVTFVSRLDERLYTVYRDTGNGYFILDAELNTRIAEQKKDVSDMLHLHLGVEIETELKALFRSAIGVPQGLFTAAFLETSVKRKSEFDRLLKVEEYRSGAEKLLATASHINARIEDARRRIAGAEGRLLRYETLTDERQANQESIAKLSAQLINIELDAARYSESVKLFDDAEQALSVARTSHARLEVEQSNAARRLADANRELAQATDAAEIELTTKDAANRHTHALEALRALDQTRAARDLLRARFDQASRAAIAADNNLARALEALETAEDARAAYEKIASDIARQTDVETELNRLRDLRAEALSARNRVAHLERELADLRLRHRETKDSVRELEALRDAARRVEDLDIERQGIETELSRAEKTQTEHKHLSENAAQLSDEITRLTRLTDKLAAEIKISESGFADAPELNEAENSERATAQRLADLRAELARDERFQKEVKGGLCPILSARCLNIPAHETLETYFVDQVSNLRAQVAEVETAYTHAQNLARRAREAERARAHAAALREQLTRERETLKLRQNALDNTNRQLAALQVLSPKQMQELRNHLQGIDGARKTAHTDALRFAKLESERIALQEVTSKGTALKNERDNCAAIANGLDELERETVERETQLAGLNNPRARAAELLRQAKREPELRAAFERIGAERAEAQAQVAQLEIELKSYSSTDEDYARAAHERDQTINDYHTHLTAAALAATLPARQLAATHAAEEAARLATETGTAHAELVRAEEAYNREAHNAERMRLQVAREQLAALQAQLKNARETLLRVEAEIKTLDEVRRTMQAELAEVARLRELFETTDFVRDTLKKAGPLVTESYLAGISLEANALFREITGDANRSLRWTRDYEVMLEEQGHERSFQNLSGGEQMAAALSIRLALLKQLSDIRLAIFDEPTINMDAERRARLAESIGNVRHFDQLFVISHDDAFEESADHVVAIGANENLN